MVRREPSYFVFNTPESACTTCGGLGSHLRADSRLFVRRPNRSIKGGALVQQLLQQRNEAGLHSVIIHSLSKYFGFSLETPWCELPEWVYELIFYGTGGEKIPIVQPESAVTRNKLVGRMITFGGFVNLIERRYQSWSAQRSSGQASKDGVFKRLMTEKLCPDCKGRRLKKQRFQVTINGRDIHELTLMQIDDCLKSLEAFTPPPGLETVALPILKQITRRLDRLVEVGVGYLNLGRRSDTLSGGEAQRVKLATQFSSGLMGILYVLDEPSIGLHAKDSELIVQSLKRLRDTGNTIIVVEHDMHIIAAADHIIEMGPGSGAQGGRIVAHGTMDQIMTAPESPTGQFLSGKASIPTPTNRRTSPAGWLRIGGAAENNLQNIDVSIPLGVLVCVTGVSGPGKSSLVHEIIYKALKQRTNPAVIPGSYRSIEGDEAITSVVDVDQSPIGRSSRSNPATYVGFYDRIRRIFSELPKARDAGLSSTDFSFNAKNAGRCEECLGTGTITTKLQFMSDIETVCPTCEGRRFGQAVLEVKWNRLSIANVLELSVDEALTVFSSDEFLTHKLLTMADLGLGYLKLGQAATTLSGGEAQRIKLAKELSKMNRGSHALYILDEPTTGLHLADIVKLIQSLSRLVDAGHTVIVIEHHLDLIKSADYVIDLGQDGGAGAVILLLRERPRKWRNQRHLIRVGT